MAHLQTRAQMVGAIESLKELVTFAEESIADAQDNVDSPQAEAFYFASAGDALRMANQLEQQLAVWEGSEPMRRAEKRRSGAWSVRLAYTEDLYRALMGLR